MPNSVYLASPPYADAYYVYMDRGEGNWPRFAWVPWGYESTYIDTYNEWTTASYFANGTWDGVYDGVSHGTHISTTLFRTAPYADFIIVDAGDKDDFETRTHRLGVQFLADLKDTGTQIDIVSLSFGVGFSGYDGTPMQTQINRLTQDGTTLVVAAVGNAEITSERYPAADENVMAVGGTRGQIQSSNLQIVHDETSIGSWIDIFTSSSPTYPVAFPTSEPVSSPIEHDPSLVNPSSVITGTSFAAPTVAGIAALYMQFYKSRWGYIPSASQIRQTIKEHGDYGSFETPHDVLFDDLDSTIDPPSGEFNFVIIDAWELLKAVPIPPPPPPPPPPPGRH